MNKKHTKKASNKELELRCGLNAEEMKEWIWLQTKIQYNEEAVTTHTSLKNVLKRRHQYSKKAQEKKEKQEKQLNYRDKALYSTNYVNVSINLKNRNNNQDNDINNRGEVVDDSGKMSWFQ